MRVLDQRVGHLLGRQYEIDQTGRDRASRHLVVFGRLRLLGHHHAAHELDLLQAECPVAAGPREDDADGPLVFLRRQRAKEKINRRLRTVIFGGRRKLQSPFGDGQVLVGRNDVNAIRFDRHSIRGLANGHRGLSRQQLDHQAFMRRGQMRDQHKRHPAVGRHVAEKLLERRQPARRCTNSHHGKAGASGVRRIGRR